MPANTKDSADENFVVAQDDVIDFNKVISNIHPIIINKPVIEITTARIFASL